MFNCNNCGASLPDGANACPYCGAVQANVNNVYTHIPNTPHDTVFSGAQNNEPRQPYGMNPQSFDENERFYFQQKLAESINDASTAKGLGIVSIICAIFFSFVIVCWICGALGIAKANSAMRFAQQTGNMQLYNEAASAKSLNKIGLIISAVILGAVVIGFIFFTTVFGILGASAVS